MSADIDRNPLSGSVNGFSERHEVTRLLLLGAVSFLCHFLLFLWIADPGPTPSSRAPYVKAPLRVEIVTERQEPKSTSAATEVPPPMIESSPGASDSSIVGNEIASTNERKSTRDDSIDSKDVEGGGISQAAVLPLNRADKHHYVDEQGTQEDPAARSLLLQRLRSSVPEVIQQMEDDRLTSGAQETFKSPFQEKLEQARGEQARRKELDHLVSEQSPVRVTAKYGNSLELRVSNTCWRVPIHNDSIPIDSRIWMIDFSCKQERPNYFDR